MACGGRHKTGRQKEEWGEPAGGRPCGGDSDKREERSEGGFWLEEGTRARRGEIQGGTKRENRGKEKEHPQVRLLNHILFVIDIFLGHFNYVMMYSFHVLHVKFYSRVI